MRALSLALGLAAVLAPGLLAQQLGTTLGGHPAEHSGENRTVTAGAHYRRGALHRALFGGHYRDLWSAPVVVPVLDLHRFAGGLTPEERGGGQQTRSLELEGADGRTYAFRSLDKDPTPAVPEMLRGTVVHRLVRDAVSAAHPGGPLISAALLRSAGVLHVEPRLALMPDDPALKEFRRDFPGVLGYIEEKPDDGFAGSSEVIDSEELLERLEAGTSDRVDARGFLRARLMDQLLGDWDRHRDQWRWAGYRTGSGTIWRPIPRDRDQALVRYDGLILALARSAHPKLVVFGPRYPGIVGLTWNGRDLDRRLLAGSSEADFGSAAAELVARLSDAAIDSALARPPEPYRGRWLDFVRSALRARRDALPEQARRYYRYLAEDVDVYATDRAEIVEAERHRDGGLTVRIRSGPEAPPHFQRRFVPGETKEVRLHLGGGADRVWVTGPLRGGTLLRIIRDRQRDTVAGAVGRGVRQHDPQPRPTAESDDPTESGVPPRDWGGSFGVGPRARYDADLGLLVGAQATRTDFAFRRQPYGSRARLAAEYAPSAGGVRLALEGDLRRQNARRRLELRAAASQLEVVRFTGLGNETPEPGGSDFYDVDQWRYSLEPLYRYQAAAGLALHAGPVARYTTTRLGGDHLIGTVRPRGAGGFGRVGVAAGLSAEAADSAPAGRKLRLDLGGSAFPPLWTNRVTFGELHGEVVARLPLGPGSAPVAALRLGAKRVWGPFPYDEAAYLGGSGTLRGYRYQRFAGDAAVYGGAELRLPLARVLEHLVPTRIGVFSLVDAGRVWARGTTSRRVHAAVGGGAWLAFFDDRYSVNLALATGREGTLWYLGTGMSY